MKIIKFTNLISIVAIAVLSVFTACSTDDPEKTDPDTALTVTPSTIIIGANAGEAVFTIQAAGDWTITDLPDWRRNKDIPHEGKAGTTEVRFAGKFNDSPEDRQAIININCMGVTKSVTIIQRRKGAITLTPDQVEIDENSKDIEIAIATDLEYEVKIEEEASKWISLKSNLPAGTGKVLFHIAPNNGGSRSARILFTDKNSDHAEALKVKQIGSPYFQDKEALMDLFNATKGETWRRKANWCSEKPIEEWQGVTVENKRVVGLELTSNRLQGYLPESIGNLTHLKTLKIDNNYLTGSLPQSLRDLPEWKNMNPYTSIYPQSAGYGFTLKDGEVTQRLHSTKGKGVNVVIVGDGFIKGELFVGTGFDKLADDVLTYLFNVEPMASYKEYFNVYSVATESNQRGITNENWGEDIDNKLGTRFNSFAGPNMNTNTDKVFSYAGKAPIDDLSETLVILIANSTRYGGITIAWDDKRAIALCSNYPVGASENPYGLEGLIHHEAIGHGLAKFDEQYLNHFDVEDATPEYKKMLEERHDKGLSLNIDTTNDPNSILWKHFIGLPGYEMVGAFEGSIFQHGIYRPEKATTCMMDNRAYYDAPSREIIVKRIMEIAGEPYSFNEFLKKDKKNISK